MMFASTLAATADAFELHFIWLPDPGRTLAFPCDASGRVDLDGLSERGRIDYFYARTLIGREFARRVMPAGCGACHG